MLDRLSKLAQLFQTIWQCSTTSLTNAGRMKTLKESISDNFIRRVSGIFQNRATLSSPHAAGSKLSESSQLIVPVVTPRKRYRTSNAETKSKCSQSRLSINEVQPKVTAAIYLLHAISLVISEQILLSDVTISSILV